MAARKLFVRLLALYVCLASPLRAGDCNGNGVDDALETAPDRAGFALRSVATSQRGLPAPLLLADLDGDERLDYLGLRFGDGDEGDMVAWPGRGDGTWGAELELFRPGGSPTLADLDGDGDPDLATAHGVEIDVFLQSAAFVFTPAGTTLDFLEPGAPVAADLNGDGLVDLLSWNSQGSVDSMTFSVFLGEGGGRLAPARNFTSVWGREAGTAADLDGDGDPDLAVQHGEQVTVLLNDGRGQFLETRDLHLESDRPMLYSLELADVDGDRDADVFAPHDGELEVLVHDGRGGFQSRRQAWPWGPGRWWLKLADLDGDGSVDIGTAPVEWPVCWRTFEAWRNDGDGGFGPWARLTAYGYPFESMLVGRIDGDGQPDLLLQSGNRLAFFSGARVGASVDCDADGLPDECEGDCDRNGVPDACDIRTGSSADCNRNGQPDECELDCNESGTPDDCDIADGKDPDCNRNGVPDSCELEDADADGIPDECQLSDGTALDCDGDGALDAVETESLLAFGAPITVIPGFEPHAMASADLDADGAAELLASGGPDYRLGVESRLHLISFHGGRSVTRSVGELPTAVGLSPADADADGDLDLAARCRVGTCYDWTHDDFLDRREVFVLLEDIGAGGLRRALEVPAGGDLDSWCFADVTGDGRADLLVTSTAGVLLREALGDGLFAPFRVVAGSEPDPGRRLYAVDVDGDRDLDLASETGRLLLNAGAGSFTEAARFPAFSGVPQETGFAREMAVADLDGDADPDFATDKIALNQGGGAFTQGQALPGATSVAAGDADGDGDVDLLAEPGDAVYYNSGRATFTTTRPADSSFMETAYVGDWNGNGTWDLALSGRGRLALAMDPGGDTHLGYEEIPDAIHDPTAADVDGDGDIDFLMGSDAIVLLRNDGTGRFAREDGADVPDGHSIESGDMDGDGDVDAIISVRQGAVVLFNDGRGRFPTSVAVVSQNPTFVPWRPADLDLDGDMDLVSAVSKNPHGILTVFNDGGSFTAPFLQELLPAVSIGEPILADVDQDRAVDLVFDAGPGPILCKNDGRGRFFAPTLLPLDGFERRGRRHSLRALLDLDGDDRVEAVLSESDRSHCSPDEEFESCSDRLGLLFLAREDGRAFEPRGEVLSLPMVMGGIAAGDIDGDGDLDTVVSLSRVFAGGDEGFGSEVALLLNDGHADFQAWGTLGVDWYPTSVLIVDVDGDARLDIVSYGADDNTLSIIRNRRLPPRRFDLDRNGVLDVCEATPFRRGDWNQDGRADLSDAIAMLERLFRGGGAFPCLDAMDANDSGAPDISDPVYLLRHLFLAGPAPPEPWVACGKDPTPDALACDGFAGCP